jgi:hypothetical protein
MGLNQHFTTQTSVQQVVGDLCSLVLANFQDSGDNMVRTQERESMSPRQSQIQFLLVTEDCKPVGERNIILGVFKML